MSVHTFRFTVTKICSEIKYKCTVSQFYLLKLAVYEINLPVRFSKYYYFYLLKVAVYEINSAVKFSSSYSLEHIFYLFNDIQSQDSPDLDT